jgi:predicted acylesterase/phospholipase RssA
MALVLGGGGAKGAYQLGVWKALEEYNRTKFTVIAGTSVGALNALLFTTTNYESAVTIWMRLADFGQLSKRWRKSVLAWIATIAVFISPIVIMFLTLLLFVSLSDGLRQRYFFVWAFVFAFEGFGLMAVVSEWGRLFGSIVGISQFILPFLLYALCLPTMIPLLYYVFSTHYLEYTKWPIVAGITRFLIAHFMYLRAEKGWGWYSDWLHTQYGKAMKSSLLDRTVLEVLVDEQLGNSERGIEHWKYKNIIVNVAKYCTFYDPHGSKPESIESPARPPGCVAQEWLPHYFNVIRMAPEQRRAVFLESAGLPFIFPNSYVEGNSYCDGGIVDNLPIAPVLSSSRLDLVIAVSLSPMRGLQVKKLYKRLDNAWESYLKGVLIADPNNPIPRTTAAEDKQKDKHFKTFEQTKPSRHMEDTEIVIISPASPLALIKLPILQFITGTMHFGAAVFELWTKQGYEDARKALDPLFGEPLKLVEASATDPMERRLLNRS